MRMQSWSVLAALVCTAVLSCGMSARAGALNPPAGPVAPTPGPEPRIVVNTMNTPGDGSATYRITQPGSYYLAGNVAGEAGKHGIVIAANGVTLDLNGFAVIGTGSAGGNFDGVTTVGAPGVHNPAVLNGTVQGWGNDGVNFGDSDTRAARIDGVRALGNVRIGVLSSQGATVSNCATFGGQYGVYAKAGSTVMGCTASGTSPVTFGGTSGGFTCENGCTISDCSTEAISGISIQTTNGCVIRSCTALGTMGLGVGVRAGDGCSLMGVSVSSGAGAGIEVGIGSSLMNCTVSSNSGFGISAGKGATVEACSAYGNGSTGIFAESESRITGCSANSNGGNGMGIGSGSVVSRCSAVNSIANGFALGDGCQVSDCTTRSNTLDGILCGSECTIRGNAATSNGFHGSGAGIHATGIGNRIESNTCTSADRGVDVDGTGNIITGNTCRANTLNWEIAMGNAVAPIVNAATNAAVISGNTYSGSLGSTDPNANFTY